MEAEEPGQPVSLNVGEAGRWVRLLLDVWGAVVGGRPSRLDTLRERLLELELAKLTGAPLPVHLEWSDVVAGIPARQDHVILGDRGSGKTALGAVLVQSLGAEGRRFSVGLPDEAARALGLRRLERMGDAPKDSHVLVDEAGLVATMTEKDARKARAELRRRMVLARHGGVSWVLCALSGAHLDLEMLRAECLVWVRRMDALRARFDREELQELLGEAVMIQAGREWRVSEVLINRGGWIHTENPLPHGWTEQVSRAYRSAW